jgi:hypothetical protein
MTPAFSYQLKRCNYRFFDMRQNVADEGTKTSYLSIERIDVFPGNGAVAAARKLQAHDFN